MRAKSSNQTMLERALARQKQQKHPVVAEEIELSIAWLRGDLGITQVCAGMYPDDKGTSGKALYRVSVCLREAYRLGKLQIAA